MPVQAVRRTSWQAAGETKPEDPHPDGAHAVRPDVFAGADDVRPYWVTLGARHGDPGEEARGGHVWRAVPQRRAIYTRLARRLPQGGPQSHVFWQAFLAREIGIMDSTAALADELHGMYAMHCAGASLEALMARLAACACRVQAWVAEQGTAGQELHVPLVFVEGEDDSDDSDDSNNSDDAAGVNHTLYVGFSVEQAGAHTQVRVRIDDSWLSEHTPHTFAPNGRLQAPPLEFTLPRSALDAARADDSGLRGLLEALTRSPQESRAGFREAVLDAIEGPAFAAAGGQIVGPLEQLRPVALQARNACFLKNHSRGIAARLQHALAAEKGQSAATCGAAAQEAWHWLKAAERDALAEVAASLAAQEETPHAGE